ncbi:MAG: immune inhibitor A [Candidatus Marinimicrobia bacterium]|nr:immune inhibitor A [Candidatus Neomarinimicrobiota bacterium]
MRSNLAIDHAEIQSDNSIIVFLNDTEYQSLQDLGYRHKVLIDDWREYYRKRRKMTVPEKQTQIRKSANKYNVTGFKFGSMGGFYTYAEIVAELDSMRLKYPHIISIKDSIGHSVENRALWAVKISDNPDIAEDEPQVCFDALIHAREGASNATIMYFMYYLLENYDRDSVVTYLVNNREIYFLPCLNPDGYEYNRLTDPNGGGMWRKNRRDNGDGSFGVDLNRNFSIAWGWDDSGSSPDGYSEVYRGTAAISEPESQYFAEFVRSKQFRTHINYHTYSNLILYPWGYISDPTPDNDIFFEYAGDISQYNGYGYGGGDAIGYFSNGTQSDWMYGDQTNGKNKTFSFVIEVGTSGDGFWAEEERIIPLAQANVGANLYLCWLPGGFSAVAGHNLAQSYFLPGDSVGCKFIVKNRGLADIDNIQINIESLSPFASINKSIQKVSKLDVWCSDTLSTGIELSLETPVGEEVVLTANTFYWNLLMDIDTVRFFVGHQAAIFSDSGSTFDYNWDQYFSSSSNIWQQTDTDFHSSPSAYTDSKDGNYASKTTTSMTLAEPIDLTGYNRARLSFWTHYEIETNWDCGMVQISNNGGFTWTALNGIYTNPGSGTGAQITGVPVYHGFQTDWVQEDIDLSAYVDETIQLRFVLKSDNYVEYDGWTIDDIRVYYYGMENSTNAITKSLTDFQFNLEPNYPNPFNPATRISYQIDRPGHVSLSIYDLLGIKIAEPVNRYQTSGEYSFLFNLNAISPKPGSGIYIVVLKSGDRQQTRKMMILK